MYAYNFKDETGHEYGPFRVIGDYGDRCKSNRVIIWECECKNCGFNKKFSGNALRFHRTAKICPRCGATR